MSKLDSGSTSCVDKVFAFKLLRAKHLKQQNEVFVDLAKACGRDDKQAM